MLVVVLLAGCGSSSGSRVGGGVGGGGGSDGSDVTASCAARAADLAAWATAVDRTYGSALLVSRNLVETRDALPLVLGNRRTELTVNHDTISVDDRPATDANAIAALIAEERQHTHAVGVELVIDREAPIALVAVAASGAIAAGPRDVQIAVARAVTPMAPPPPSSVTDELEASAAGSTERAVALARVMRRVTAGCPAFIRALNKREEKDASKSQIVIGALQPALVECSCRIDLDAFRSALWVLLGPGPFPPAGIVPVTLSTDDDRGAVIATGKTWGDAAPAVFAAAAAGKHVRIVAPSSH
jgi:hypothetical protein